jgi:2-amino-4-hydroxy-6-hydroxymethyldihydropteridine diphosphokinase
VIRTYVALGANLGDRRGNLEYALTLLSHRPGVRLVRVASLYESEPVEAAGGWFLNSVAAIETSLHARDFLEGLMQVEGVCGRPPLRQRGEARAIDLDLLLYGSQVICEPQIEVPHPRMHLRPFVLLPLAELDPNLVHPGLGVRVVDLLVRVPVGSGVRLVSRDWYATLAEGRRGR